MTTSYGDPTLDSERRYIGRCLSYETKDLTVLYTEAEIGLMNAEAELLREQAEQIRISNVFDRKQLEVE
jgi:hypothetical protein